MRGRGEEGGDEAFGGGGRLPWLLHRGKVLAAGPFDPEEHAGILQEIRAPDLARHLPVVSPRDPGSSGRQTHADDV